MTMHILMPLTSCMILCRRGEWNTSFFAPAALRPRACRFFAGVWLLSANVMSQLLKSIRTYSLPGPAHADPLLAILLRST